MRFWADSNQIKKYRDGQIISPERMRVIDSNAMALGVSDLQLMENAGHALVNVVRRYHPASILILCGSGNNGGDGMVAARLLAHETDVTVIYHNSSTMSLACKTQLSILENCAVRLLPVRCKDDVHSIKYLFSQSTLILDALLGTGMAGDVREPHKSCVILANETKLPIISADMPTPGIIPTIICSFHRAKSEGAENADIGIPVLAEICTGPGDLLMIPDRNPSAHKGIGGSILVIGGGPYQGAPYLAGMSALRAGADIVRVASPSPLQFPDLIHIPTKNEQVSEDDIDILANLCENSDVVICGMGLGPDSHEVVTKIAPFCKKAVFDADALRLPLPVAKESLYTPHTGEFTRITGINPGTEIHARADAVKKASDNGTILLKGETDIISDGNRIRFNRTGTPAMTTGGTGDVLAGVCGALFVVLPAFDAACIGAYATGSAGELVTKQTGYGLTAQDIIPAIPQILYRHIIERDP
ncbi:NAD(P)H-hydrate dehydratase [Methanospirillum lacunae]|uniref:ADP-dependent (S)-NAD(P)H-hydrate dehydratase n=2 Tax=Methanospirillum lacunae TaxID=668570 RepID=A0A2V2N0H8_9EURY|nr:NAD(P)H-hydrate dehydratase [Methanospirillum lacunae]PWR70038.1 bifunctional ADP-dependent NAD(P)H-hydrate dehydratase/NAD(P)H-hydrate epimerase [Methanospirillum lacunae]